MLMGLIIKRAKGFFFVGTILMLKYVTLRSCDVCPALEITTFYVIEHVDYIMFVKNNFVRRSWLYDSIIKVNGMIGSWT